MRSIGLGQSLARHWVGSVLQGNPRFCYAMLYHAMPCYAMLCHAMPCYAMHGWEITMSSNLLQRAPLVWVQLLQYNTCAKMRNSRLINCGPSLNVRHLLDFDAEMRCPELHSTDFSIARRHLVQHQHISSIWISFGPGALCIRMSIGLPRYWLSRAKDSPSST